MEPELVIAFAGLLFGGFSLLLAILQARSKADETYVLALERRIEVLEIQLAACKQRETALMEERVFLLRKVMDLEERR